MFSRKSFTLTEMLVALTLSTVLIGMAMSAFVSQQRVHRRQQQWGEARQNARTAADILLRDIRMAGYGLPVPASEIAGWVSWVSNVTQCVQITDSGGSSPDSIYLVGAFESPLTTLSSATAPGSRTLRLPLLGALRLDTSRRSLIFIGKKELARVISIAGHNVTVTSDNTRTDQGLRFAHRAGAPVELVQVVEYAVRPATTNYPYRPFLIRDTHSLSINSDLQKMVVIGIEDLQLAVATNIIECTVVGRTDEPDPRYTDPVHGDGYWRKELTVHALPRN